MSLTAPQPASRPAHAPEGRPAASPEGRPCAGSGRQRPRLAATLADELRRQTGRRVLLALTNAVGTAQAHTDFPTGRVVAVEADYVALDDVTIPGLAAGAIGLLAISLARVVALARAGAGTTAGEWADEPRPGEPLDGTSAATGG